jgi:Zn-dependent peptidase ImmA (M78 family)
MDEADVQHRARTFVASVDTTNIQNDLSAYVRAANAKVLKEELGEGESGTTFTRPDGKHLITVNTLESAARQRFTVCHEIAHIILGLPSSHEAVPSWGYVKRDPNEWMCDLFAAELLMPYKLWKERAPKGEPSQAVVDYMAAEFNCSFPAAASRYATLADCPCAYVTMEHGKVRYAALSMSLRRVGARIPLRSPIPPGSIAHRLRTEAHSQLHTGEVAQDVWFQDWESGLDMTEMARHYQSSDTTVALLWFTDDDLPTGEVNRFGVRIAEDAGLDELTGELPWPGGGRRK